MDDDKIVPQDAFDPNEPAFKDTQSDSLKIPDDDIPAPTPEGSQPEDREGRSGLSPRAQKRIDRLTWEREEAARNAQAAQERADRLERMMEQSLSSRQEDEVPEKWRRILGEDNPQTKEFYKALNEEIQSRAEQAAQQARQALREEQEAEYSIASEISDSIDEQREELEDTLGRHLSDEEAADVLDVMDEFSPDREHLMPFSAAYEVWNSRSGAHNAARRQQRDEINSLVGQGNGGRVTPEQVIPKGQPDPGGWRRALGL